MCLISIMKYYHPGILQFTLTFCRVNTLLHFHIHTYEFKLVNMDICLICLHYCETTLPCCNGFIHIECLLRLLFNDWGLPLNRVRCPHCRANAMGLGQENDVEAAAENDAESELEDGEIREDENAMGYVLEDDENVDYAHVIQPLNANDNAVDFEGINALEIEPHLIDVDNTFDNATNDDDWLGDNGNANFGPAISTPGFPSVFPDLEDGIHFIYFEMLDIHARVDIRGHNIAGVEWI